MVTRRRLRKVGTRYKWFIRDVPYGKETFKTKKLARKYLEIVDRQYR